MESQTHTDKDVPPDVSVFLEAFFIEFEESLRETISLNVNCTMS